MTHPKVQVVSAPVAGRVGTGWALLSWAGRHRLVVSGAALVLVLVLAAAGVWFLVLRSPGTSVDLEQALRQYEQDRGGAAGGAGVPAPGVYRYRTSGGEQLSLAAISRAFPRSSQMIVTDRTRCTTMLWEPLVQHTEGIVVCRQRNGARTISSAPSYEDIAGIRSSSVIRCPPGVYLVPPEPAAGSRWRATCHSSGQPVVFTGSVVGLDSLRVDGAEVPALHVRLVLSFSGNQKGANPNNYWISLRDGLILRQRETVDLAEAAGPLGSVRYTEKMAITLMSVTPSR